MIQNELVARLCKRMSDDRADAERMVQSLFSRELLENATMKAAVENAGRELLRRQAALDEAYGLQREVEHKVANRLAARDDAKRALRAAVVEEMDAPSESLFFVFETRLIEVEASRINGGDEGVYIHTFETPVGGMK